MLNTQLAKKYAKAIFEIAVEDDKLPEIGAQLDMVSAAVEQNEELKNFVGNPKIQAAAKKAVMEKLFADDTTDVVYNFLMLLIDKHRESLLREIALAYKALSNAAQNIVEANVTVAASLTGEQEEKLVKKLEMTTGKTVVIHTKIDKSIIGGVVVRIGDKLIDGSVVRRMQALKAQLLAN